jgi:putative hydrolase of the HAD superfamily
MITSIPSSLLPIPETVKLIYSLKEKGHKLFILSNIPFISIEYVEKEYPFFSLFEGVIVSCRVNMIKPEPEIYKHLLCKYSLQIENTIFIDDSDKNISVASSLGIRTIKFHNPSQCEYELKNIGCI